jgi:hypothetical protein
MILGKPKKLDDYICVNSQDSIILHKLGFIPEHREVYYDRIYYIKTEELENIMKEVDIVGLQK